MKEKKQILCFSVEHKKETRIQDVCRKLGIQTKTVSGEQYGCALGYLAGIPPVPLKAILTPTNVFWSAHKLYRVLWAEHH